MQAENPARRILFYLIRGKEGRKMEQEFLIKGSWLIVAMPEEVDHHSAAILRNRVDAILDHQPVRHVAFDFSRTTFMDSSGIGMIMGRYRKVIQKNGEVRAIHVDDRINRILQLSGIYKIIEISRENSEEN